MKIEKLFDFRMNWVDGLLADSAEIINEEGVLPKGYYQHVRLQDDRNCSLYYRYILYAYSFLSNVFLTGKSQKKFIINFTKPEEIMAKRRPDKKLDFQGMLYCIS